MLLLALDTATEKGSLALVAGDRVLMEYSLESHNAYLTCLMPGVAAILRNTGKEAADLAAVAVSIGPGNFTGLRIGLATAKTLAWSLGRPLVPVPTMEVLAAQFPFHPHPIGVVMDAKRGEVFWGLFRCPEDRPQVLEGPLRLPVGELPARLHQPLLLTGPGLDGPPGGAGSAALPGDCLGPAGTALTPGLDPGPAGAPPPGAGPHRQPRPTGPHLPAPGAVMSG